MNTRPPSKFIGVISGRSVYREKRGVNHVASVRCAGQSEYCGTIREISKILRGRFHPAK